jgi:hypothetical protein
MTNVFVQLRPKGQADGSAIRHFVVEDGFASVKTLSSGNIPWGRPSRVEAKIETISGDLSEYFGSDTCDLNTDAAVARPRRRRIYIPRHNRYQQRNQRDGKCGKLSRR